MARAESDLRDRTSAAVICVASVLYARGFYEKLGKHHAVDTEQSLSSIVEAALSEHLERRAKGRSGGD